MNEHFREDPTISTARERLGVKETDVCVIIAVRNAQTTIATAIASALREPEVAEVIVVDDCSSDDTISAARSADDATHRLKVVRLEANRGPSHARNLAIAQSRSPLIAILDGDDFFFPGRFRNLLAEEDWDLAADNIMFLPETADPESVAVPRLAPDPGYLTLDAFVAGNISKRKTRRGELGFLKPVMRRAFLELHDLRYDESLRLGEDYELYARALACGARFKIIRSCGYGATVRAGSLSGRHATDDLKRLADADQALSRISGLSKASKAALAIHEAHIRDKYRLRQFLDLKNQKGAGSAIAFALSQPANLLPIATGIAADKYDALVNRTGIAENVPDVRTHRLLLEEGLASTASRKQS